MPVWSKMVNKTTFKIVNSNNILLTINKLGINIVLNIY